MQPAHDKPQSEPRAGNSTGLYLGLTIVLLVFYVLSPMPAYAIINRFDCLHNPILLKSVEIGYAPLIWSDGNFPCVHRFYVAYAQLWGV